MVPFTPMVTKVLLTLAVLALAWLVIRSRSKAPRRGGPPAASEGLPVPAWVPRALAYGLVSVIVAGMCITLWRTWSMGREPVTVRVINANTGKGATYRARRQDVSGRSFLTLDGRRISLADIERLELEDTHRGTLE